MTAPVTTGRAPAGPGDGRRPAGTASRPHTRGGGGRGWLLVLAVAVGWSAWDAGALDRSAGNPGGLDIAGRFLAGAAAPDLSTAFLAEVGDATLVTLAYGVLGTVVSVLLGLLAGLVLSRTWWRGRRLTGRGGGPGWLLARAGLALPRGLHEAVWALLLVVVLGPDPVAGVLAIAIPYGAITAKVYADLLDAVPREPYTALVATGSGRLTACCYALLPGTAADMLSYALYRFDCAIRSAVILGIVGAGGLGLLLDSAFQDLSYGRMWTCIYALMLVCGAGDQVSRRLRRRLGEQPTGSHRTAAVAAVTVAVSAVAAWQYLGVDVSALWAERARAEAGYLARAAWPPQLPAGGAGALLDATVRTLSMSVLAMALAAAAAVALAPLAAGTRGPGAGPVHRILQAGCRAALLLARAVPSPVWALLLLFVLHPGPLPGVLALAVYNLGVLGRLAAEVVEDLPAAPSRAIALHGAGRVAVYAYGVLPRALPRLLAYTAYRWEVAVRETVVVGLVGAGGLGYLLARQLAAFDWGGVAATLAALVVLTGLVDLVGSAARRALP